MDRIGVLFLQNWLPVGGYETHLLSIIRELDKDAFHPVVCCLKDGGSLEPEFRAAGIPVYTGIQGWRLNPAGITRLVGIMKREQITILDSDLQRNTVFIGALAARIARIPAAVISAHVVAHMHRSRVIEWPARVSLGKFDRVIALFDAHRDQLINEEGVEAGKVIVKWNGVDTRTFCPGDPAKTLRSELGIPSGAPVVGIIASLFALKAHDVFLKVATRVLESHPNARFLVVGEGEERPKMEEMSRRMKLDKSVHFLGQRRDVLDLHRLIDIIVLTSLWEAHPISILESMACGNPSVTTRVGAMPDMVVEGETGFMLDVGDVEGLAAATSRLLGDPELRRTMGGRARRRVENAFSIEKIVRAREVLYRRLLEEKSTQD